MLLYPTAAVGGSKYETRVVEDDVDEALTATMEKRCTHRSSRSVGVSKGTASRNGTGPIGEMGRRRAFPALTVLGSRAACGPRQVQGWIHE